MDFKLLFETRLPKKLGAKYIKKESKFFYDLLSRYFKVFPPMPAPISKINGSYRWRIIAKCNLTNSIIENVNKALSEYYQLNNKDVRITIDVNPGSMM